MPIESGLRRFPSPLLPSAEGGALMDEVVAIASEGRRAAAVRDVVV